MRKDNFKIGWLVENKLLALTHFHSDITAEDIQGVFRETTRIASRVSQPFHMIIDNRLAPLKRIFRLSEMQNSSSALRHPLLETLIIIKPIHLTLTEEHRKEEISDGVKLINTDSVIEALELIGQANLDVQTEGIGLSFFPDVES